MPDALWTNSVRYDGQAIDLHENDVSVAVYSATVNSQRALIETVIVRESS